ncbi:MAG: iron ABC transporter permease [Actinomycetota bacterium]
MLAIGAPAPQTALALFAGFLTVGIMLRVSRMIPATSSGVRFGGFSAVVGWRTVWLTAGAVGLAVTLLVVGLIVGDFPVPVVDALRTAFFERGGEYDFVVNTLRFPRVVTALLAGICLGLSGAIFQTLIGNPLVSPDIIGIDQGAAVCAVFILVVGGNIALLPIAAFAGALATALFIYVLAWKRGVSGTRLVLVGIGVNAVLAAVVTFMLVRFPIERVAAAARWQAGTLFGSSWEDVRILAVGLILLSPLAWYWTRKLRMLELGDEAAAALGIRVERDRLILIAIGAGLASFAVAVVGPLSFVALLVPHLARLLGGPMTTGLLALTAALGAGLLLGADLVAQRLFAPTTLPAGVVTAAIGGPYFLYLLYRYNRAI